MPCPSLVRAEPYRRPCRPGPAWPGAEPEAWTTSLIRSVPDAMRTRVHAVRPAPVPLRLRTTYVTSTSVTTSGRAARPVAVRIRNLTRYWLIRGARRHPDFDRLRRLDLAAGRDDPGRRSDLDPRARRNRGSPPDVLRGPRHALHAQDDGRRAARLHDGAASGPQVSECGQQALGVDPGASPAASPQELGAVPRVQPSVAPLVTMSPGRYARCHDAPFRVRCLDVRRVGGGGGSRFGDPLAVRKVDGDGGEQRAPECQLGRSGHLRVAADRRPHIPRAHGAEVVVAGQPAWGRR